MSIGTWRLNMSTRIPMMMATIYIPMTRCPTAPTVTCTTMTSCPMPIRTCPMPITRTATETRRGDQLQ